MYSEIAFYKDSADATVAVERARNEGESSVILRINGKTDASSKGDLATQYLLAHLPLAAKPDATNVFGHSVSAVELPGEPFSITPFKN